MICVTGAGGTVGSELIKGLESAKAPFRAAYFSKKKAEAARAKGIDAVIMDYVLWLCAFVFYESKA